MEQMALWHAAPERDNADHFSRLPDEVILEIFRGLWMTDLWSLALVCRRFSGIIEEPRLWSWMNITLSRRTVKPGTMDTIMRRQVKDLAIYFCNVLSPIFLDSSVALRSDFQWRLVHLAFAETLISPESLIAILTKCRQLETIYLENVAVTDDVLEAVGANNKELQEFTMDFRKEVSAEAFKNLLNGCTKLRSLYLSGTDFNRGTGDAISGNLPSSLRVLELSYCGALLKDRNVVQIVKNCPHLNKVDFSDADRITSRAVKALSTLSKLQSLSLRECFRVDARSVLYLRTAKSLSYIDLVGCDIDEDTVEDFRDDFRGLLHADGTF